MNLLVTGAWTDGKKYIEELKEMGHCVSYMQYEKDELPCTYEWVEGVICNGLFLYHTIEKFVNLKYIQLTSAGYDRVPIEYVKKKEIAIYNAGDVYAIPMAEFVVAGVLQIYKKMEFFRKNQKRHLWEKNRNLEELNGKTVCIIGCGNVGTECAKRFHAFGCKVIGVNRSYILNEAYTTTLSLNKLDEVLPEADIVVLTIALTEQTYHLINRTKLQSMKASAILVNISRGAVIDTAALLDAIENIGGAVLDVLEEEPLEENSQLWEAQNVIITPHNSFVGEGNGERLKDIIFLNLNC